jgi:tetratricopeptide (TPR) repeat protein
VACAKSGFEPPAAVELDVPFVPQQTDTCGPASLAMLLRWNGRHATAEELVPEVFAPERSGTLQLSLVAAALLAELGAGHPVIVLQQLARFGKPRWHYAVATGHTSGGAWILLHSGTRSSVWQRGSRFSRSWARADAWGLLVLPPDELPATATEKAFLRAAVGLERAGRNMAAEGAYRAAAQRWPGSLGAWLGLGNVAHARGDYAAAASAFREAAERHPEAPAVWNNLADAESRLGHHALALDAARRAVSLGEDPVFERTLREVEDRAPTRP